MKFNLNSGNSYDLNLIDESKRDLVLILPGGAYAYTSERESGVVANAFSDLFHQAIYYYREEIILYPKINEEVYELLNILKKHEKINKIYIIGFSAGGHFGAMISSLYPDYVDKLILCYPVITTNPRYMHLNSFINLFGKKPTKDELEEVSMERKIHSQFPPTFIMHTMTDMSVPVENSLLLIEALKANKVYVESHLYPTGRHGISIATEKVCFEDMSEKEFLETYGYISEWVRLAKLFLKKRTLMINILLSRGIIGRDDMVIQLKDVIKKEYKVCVLAFSFFDKHISSKEAYDSYYKKGGEYYQKMIDSFAPYDIKENQISWVYYFDDTKESAKQKISDADIIYFPGGSPDQMMIRIIEFDLKEHIEAQDKIFIGSSAGAMIQFDDYHISKDVDYDCFSLQEGLSLINDFIIEVHYRRRKKQKSALRKMHRLTHKNIYGIPDEGAIIYDNNKVKLINCASQLYNHKGVVRK